MVIFINNTLLHNGKYQITRIGYVIYTLGGYLNFSGVWPALGKDAPTSATAIIL
jgi:hypothetical protein